MNEKLITLIILSFLLAYNITSPQELALYCSNNRDNPLCILLENLDEDKDKESNNKDPNYGLGNPSGTSSGSTRLIEIPSVEIT